MIDTTLLLPPSGGPRANPLLFGIAEGLSALFPPIEPTDPNPKPESRSDDDGRATQEAASHAARTLVLRTSRPTPR